MAQTAVEFLVSKLPLGVKDAILDKIEQAKQMDKEQSKRDYYAGLEGYIVKDGGFDQYYNETYGK